MTALWLAERGLLADAIVRVGMRRLLRRRLRQERARATTLDTWRQRVRDQPIARVPHKANEQHYEVPPDFFALCLGHHLKYSSGYWAPFVTTLDDAEHEMLSLTCTRARVADGQDILELGCGWGSLTLWMAERFPASRIRAVSNSHLQRTYIERQCADRGLDNVRVVTADINDFSTTARFDRIVSVEMFEHLYNYELLFRRLRGWLTPDGCVFVHVFCHRQLVYDFEIDGDHDWMARHFFTGGIMPSFDTFGAFDANLGVAEQWWINGTHYAKTARAWLCNLDVRRADAVSVLNDVYGADTTRWYHRWRMFFMACEELFGWDDGQAWGVGHYSLRPVSSSSGP